MSKVLAFRNWLQGERTAVEATAVTIADNLTALFQIAGMLFLPGLPASLVFYALWLSLPQAPVLAAIAAVALEAVGVVSCKTTMRLYRGWRREYVQMPELITGVLAAMFYGGLVSVTLYFADGLPGLAGALGWISPWLAITLYLVTGFNVDLEIREEERADILAYQRDQGRVLEQAELDLRLKNLQLKAELAARQQEMRLTQEMEAFKAKLELKNRAQMARLEAKLANSGQKRSPQALLQEAERIYGEYNGQISGPDMAELLGVELRTAQNYITRVKNSNGRVK